jgi:hypothetical protein
MVNMKKLIYLFVVTALLIVINGCTEDKKAPLFQDSDPPGPVSSPEASSIPGGAIISYTLPDDEDLLYVRAEYTLTNGKKMEAKSSNYLNSLVVQGFGDVSEKTVTLYAVDRSENESTPIQVKITPDIPDVHAVKATTEMLADFGGVSYRWTNENNAALAIMLLAEDSTGVLSVVETLYSSVTNGDYTIRGFDPEEQEFAIIMRDRWDNYSDTSKALLTPMYEEELDKEKFLKVVLANDQSWDAWEGRYEHAFDDDINTFNHTYAGTGWPQYLTVDLGVEARLSRVVIHQRQTFPYRHGNPRLMDIWGILESPEADGSLDKWYPLRVAPDNGCVARRPSTEGGTTAEDQEHMARGDEYSFSIDDPAIRYLRFVVNETWGLTGFSHFGEITVYGQEVVEN